MITIQVKRDNSITLPKQATEFSAGYDIIATSDAKIVGEKLEDKYFKAGEPKSEWWKYIAYIEYETGLYITPTEESIHTLIYPRSSISSKANLMLGNAVGVIDRDYNGQLLCRFKYIWQPFDMAWLHVTDYSKENDTPTPMMVGNINPERIYKKGDTIAQLIFSSTINANFQLVDELPKTVRGSGGFGSTDKEKKIGMPRNQGIYGSIAEAYQEAGGVQVKKRYSDEIKERERAITNKPSSNNKSPILPGIHERTG